MPDATAPQIAVMLALAVIGVWRYVQTLPKT